MRPLALDSWSGEDVRIAQVEDALGRLRTAVSESAPSIRTSVMTHIAWVPDEWLEPARRALGGMAERHPSRTVILVPEPDAPANRIDATVALECFQVPDVERSVCSEVLELRLKGSRAHAPASIVLPLLISDLPVFLRWRGLPAWGSQAFEQLLDVVDRLIVDSTEWPDPQHEYARLAEAFDRVAASDIAWARTSRWRRLLATLWPGIAEVHTIGVTGTKAQALLLCGWLRSRLGRDDIDWEHVEADRLEGIELDGEAAPFPPGDPPQPSDVLSDELETYSRDTVYEAAVRAIAL